MCVASQHTDCLKDRLACFQSRDSRITVMVQLYVVLPVFTEYGTRHASAFSFSAERMTKIPLGE